MSGCRCPDTASRWGAGTDNEGLASIVRTIAIAAPAERVWDALSDYANVHTRLAPGFVTAAHMDGETTRVLTFFNGLQARETLVSCDDSARRLVYTVRGGRAEHHNAAAQVFEDGPSASRFVWVTDVLPDELAPYIGDMMDRGAAVMKATLEAA